MLLLLFFHEKNYKLIRASSASPKTFFVVVVVVGFQEDVVMTRVITTGVGTIEIGDPPYRYTVVDVGGQRNERKKWLHCFDDVKAIVFLVSLAGYNQVSGTTHR